MTEQNIKPERKEFIDKLIAVKKKACIFDLDGTIADTVRSIAYTGNQTLGAFSYPPLPVENYNYYAGDGAKELCRRFLSAARDGRQNTWDAPTEWERAKRIPDDDAEFQAVYGKYQELFVTSCMYEVKPFPGIMEMLNGLKERGIRIAVLSNKPHGRTVDVVERVFGKNFFDIVQGQVDGVPKKPAPDGAWKIAEAFGAKPEECIYSGDTDTDMQTGNAAGMLTLGVLWGFRDEAELTANHAMALIRKPGELLSYLGDTENI
ncbi:MAG: HAD family hydrolase [Eubacteriales bacterium]|nr:HAD family hydrolase [Eubacteriales bacterium]